MKQKAFDGTSTIKLCEPSPVSYRLTLLNVTGHLTLQLPLGPNTFFIRLFLSVNDCLVKWSMRNYSLFFLSYSSTVRSLMASNVSYCILLSISSLAFSLLPMVSRTLLAYALLRNVKFSRVPRFNCFLIIDWST